MDTTIDSRTLHAPSPSGFTQAKRRRRSQHVAGRGKTRPRACQVMHHGFKAATKVVYQYMLDMTSGGYTQSGRYFFGSPRNTARNLSMSESTVEASYKDLLKFSLIMYPSDPKEEWSKFGSRNYVVLTHDEWASTGGGRGCRWLGMDWEDD